MSSSSPVTPQRLRCKRCRAVTNGHRHGTDVQLCPAPCRGELVAVTPGLTERMAAVLRVLDSAPAPMPANDIASKLGFRTGHRDGQRCSHNGKVMGPAQRVIGALTALVGRGMVASVSRRDGLSGTAFEITDARRQANRGPSMTTDELNQRRREFTLRCVARADEHMRTTYARGVRRVDAEMMARYARALEGAARELARTGELRDLGIERPSQITRARATYTEGTAGDVQHLGSIDWHEPLGIVSARSGSFDFTGTVLGAPCAEYIGDQICGGVQPCALHGAPPARKRPQ